MFAALIENGTVTNIIVVDESTDLAEFDGYRLCGEDVAIGWSYDGGEFVAPQPSEIPPVPEPVVTILPAVTMWERMTEAEAEQVNAAMATQPFRTRQIFLTANTFRSDHELWPLLVQMATDLFGEARAAELLGSN